VVGGSWRRGRSSDDELVIRRVGRRHDGSPQTNPEPIPSPGGTVLPAASAGRARWGQALVTDPARVGVTRAAGVDETKFLAAKRREPTRWASAICDVDRRAVST
jgi:hypothetical protein